MEVNPITLHKKESSRSPSRNNATEIASEAEPANNDQSETLNQKEEGEKLESAVGNQQIEDQESGEAPKDNINESENILNTNNSEKPNDISEKKKLTKSVRIVEPPKEEEEEEDEEEEQEVSQEEDEETEETEKEHSDEANGQNDDYEPELKAKPEINLPITTSPESSDEKLQVSEEEDEEYDPEKDQPSLPSLPPKPPVIATSHAPPSTFTSNEPKPSNETIYHAFELVIQEEINKNPNILQLGLDDQAQIFQSHIDSLGPSFPGSHWNYNQVYSYNKPFKNLKEPVALIPVNEFCRRPNITAPMTPEEEAEYEEFIVRENHYLNLQNWDEFPDKSRLFVGNLPANTISKQDLFRIFSKYGEVIQIAIKAGYGFTQFRTAEACLDCIKGEEGVPLHNKTLRLDASKPQKSRRSGNPDINNPNFSGRGRERHGDDEPPRKKWKGNYDCMVYVTGKSSVFFIRKVKKIFASSQITIDTEDVTQRNITDVLSEAAYSGVLGACVIKEQKVDLQTYETQPGGGIKFDEYADIEPEEAAEVMVKVKMAKYQGNPPPYIPQDISYNDNDKHNNKFGGRHQRNDHGRGRGGNRGGRGGRGGGRGGRFNDNYGRDRDNKFNHDWSDNNQYQQPHQQFPPQQQSYGQIPQPQFSPYGQQLQPQNQQYSSPYGMPQQSPPQQQQGFNQYGAPMSQPQPPQQNNQNYLQALQSLDPMQVQNMINLLQQQQQGTSPTIQMQPMQQQQPPPQPYNRAPPSINYGSSNQIRRGGGGPRGGYGNMPHNSRNNQPYGNVPQPHQNSNSMTSPGYNPNSNLNNNAPNALLSRLQQSSNSNGRQQNPYSQPQPQNNQDQSTASLLETLQKLSGK
ncbi:NAB3 [Candida jiufengensis]|uniref:NAB3 n=1 Tax=Candida jiufengensis TaxID=497108 RepID=UPI002223FC32|nr:NAB3 [Candida jiufengensis]KAI5956910.1 NAB3 [Candida jiufengensis]